MTTLTANMTIDAPATNLNGGSTDTIATTDVLGVQISALTMPNAVSTIERWIETGERHYVCICTVHTVMECQRDPALQEAVNAAGLRTPDGMPLVWLSHRAGHKEVTRVYGPDLMLELCARSETTKHRHFFYGGAPGVADQLAAKLSARFPGLNVAGFHTPPMLPVSALESEETIAKINASNADIVWVGLGTPKQDWWVANHRPLLTAPVVIAVGAAFDFHSGHVRQAPTWMQQRGLEWMFRLSQDPARLWQRYLVGNSEFLLRLIGSLNPIKYHLNEGAATKVTFSTFVKSIVEKTAAFSLLRRAHQDVQIVRWTRSGCPAPPPHIIKQLALLNRAAEYKIDTMVETGTYLGNMVLALANHFSTIYSIEVDEALFNRARRKFARMPHVILRHGDSGTVLADLVPSLPGRTLFWLDGHFSGGITSMSDETTPILTELRHIAASGQNHVVVIDDARCFDGTDGYPTLETIQDFVHVCMPNYKVTIDDDMISLLPCA